MRGGGLRLAFGQHGSKDQASSTEGQGFKDHSAFAEILHDGSDSRKAAEKFAQEKEVCQDDGGQTGSLVDGDEDAADNQHGAGQIGPDCVTWNPLGKEFDAGQKAFIEKLLDAETDHSDGDKNAPTDFDDAQSFSRYAVRHKPSFFVRHSSHTNFAQLSGR